MAIVSKVIPAGSEQTITISGATTYDFYGMTIENQAALAAGTTITIKNSGSVSVMETVYVKAFPDGWVPGTAGESPWKKVAPCSGPIKVTISGAVSGLCNLYYQTRS